MKDVVEGESTGSWTPMVRRSSLDDFRRSQQSCQDSIERLNVAESPLLTPITATQITCSKDLGDIRSYSNQAWIQLSDSLEDANLKTVTSVEMPPIRGELFPNEACSMHFPDSYYFPLWDRPVLPTAVPFYTPISGGDFMQGFMPQDGFFAPIYDTVVLPTGHNLEQERDLATSRWHPFHDGGFHFPSQEDETSMKTQRTFLHAPFDEMEALTGWNLHNICLTASKSCPLSLQPDVTRLTPLGAKQALRRMKSEKTNIMTPMKKRMNKSQRKRPQATIKHEHAQHWKTNRKQRTSKRRTLVSSSSQDSEIVNNGQLSPRASVGRVQTRARSTFADMVRDKVIKTGPQIWSVGHDANTYVFIKPNGKALQPSSLSTEWSPGSIVYKETEFNSISSFALAVIRERNPCRLACDGWKDVKCEGRRLDSLREMYLYSTPS